MKTPNKPTDGTEVSVPVPSRGPSGDGSRPFSVRSAERNAQTKTEGSRSFSVIPAKRGSQLKTEDPSYVSRSLLLLFFLMLVIFLLFASITWISHAIKFPTPNPYAHEQGLIDAH